jgi:hypothetical protein
MRGQKPCMEAVSKQNRRSPLENAPSPLHAPTAAHAPIRTEWTNLSGIHSHISIHPGCPTLDAHQWSSCRAVLRAAQVKRDTRSTLAGWSPSEANAEQLPGALARGKPASVTLSKITLGAESPNAIRK